MIIKKVSIFSKDYCMYKDLQLRAFPKEEQYPLWALHLLAMRKGIDYLAYYDDGEFCGISYTSCIEKTVYVLYLAVNDKIRSKGYGSRILKQIKEQNINKEIVLNIEPVDEAAENYEQRRRRAEFYYRNGYCDTGYKMVDITGEYSILSTSDEFSVDAYKKAIAQIGMNVYKPEVVQCVEHIEG